MKKIQEIIKDLKSLRKKDKELQKSIYDFFKIFFPGSHAPIIEYTLVYGYLQSFNKKQREFLEDWLYEPDISVVSNGEVYNFENEKDLIKFWNKEIQKDPAEKTKKAFEGN